VLWLRLATGNDEAAFDGFGGAAFAAFHGLGKEDAEQVISALERGHEIPASPRFWLVLEFRTQDRRGFVFAFNGQHEAFGHGFGAFLAGLSGFGIGDEAGEALAHGGTHGIERSLQSAIGLENFGEFRGEIDNEFTEIGRELDEDAVTCLDVGANLHFFVDDEDLALTSGCGNQRSFESETVDFAEDAAALPSGPRLFEINRNADDDPSERGTGSFEGRAEGL